jgi:hypothetical protein
VRERHGKRDLLLATKSGTHSRQRPRTGRRLRQCRACKDAPTSPPLSQAPPPRPENAAVSPRSFRGYPPGPNSATRERPEVFPPPRQSSALGHRRIGWEPPPGPHA